MATAKDKDSKTKDTETPKTAPAARDTDDKSKDKDAQVEIQDKVTGETRTVSRDEAVDLKPGERIVTDTDRLAGTVLATGRDTSESDEDALARLDSPRSAKGPQADEIPAPAADSGDLATSNLSTEAQREGKRIGVGQRNEKMIAALLREREGVAANGKGDRVAQIDEQLQHYGYDPKKDSRSRLPEGRTSNPTGQQTA